MVNNCTICLDTGSDLIVPCNTCKLYFHKMCLIQMVNSKYNKCPVCLCNYNNKIYSKKEKINNLSIIQNILNIIIIYYLIGCCGGLLFKYYYNKDYTFNINKKIFIEQFFIFKLILFFLFFSICRMFTIHYLILSIFLLVILLDL